MCTQTLVFYTHSLYIEKSGELLLPLYCNAEEFLSLSLSLFKKKQLYSDTRLVQLVDSLFGLVSFTAFRT